MNKTPIHEILRELFGELRWSLEMSLALSPVGRMVGARFPHIQDMRKFGAALIVEFEPPRKWAGAARP